MFAQIHAIHSAPDRIDRQCINACFYSSNFRVFIKYLYTPQEKLVTCKSWIISVQSYDTNGAVLGHLVLAKTPTFWNIWNSPPFIYSYKPIYREYRFEC